MSTKGKVYNPDSGRYVNVDSPLGKRIIANNSAVKSRMPVVSQKSPGASPKSPSRSPKIETLTRSPSRSPKTRTGSPVGSPKTGTVSRSPSRSPKTKTLSPKSSPKTRTPSPRSPPKTLTDLPPELQRLIFSSSSPKSSTSLFLATKGINKSIQDSDIWKTKIQNEFGVVKIKQGDSPSSAYNKLNKYRSFFEYTRRHYGDAFSRRHPHILTKQAFLEKVFPLVRKSEENYNSYRAYWLERVERDTSKITSLYKSSGETYDENNDYLVTNLAIMMYNGEIFADREDGYSHPEGIPSSTIRRLRNEEKKVRQLKKEEKKKSKRIQ